PYPIWPPKTGAPHEEQPNHFTISLADREIPQMRIGSRDMIEEALVLFKEMNGQSGPSRADRNALAPVIAGIIRDIQGIRDPASDGHPHDFDLLLVPSQEEAAGQNYRLGLNGWHAGASQFHAHMQAVRVAFPVEQAKTAPYGRIGAIQVSLLADDS